MAIWVQRGAIPQPGWNACAPDLRPRRGSCETKESDMKTRRCVQLTSTERVILRRALLECVRRSHSDASEMVRLEKKLRRASDPRITVGIEDGMVYWVTGNPFPIRICDYDIDGVYPKYKDELGRRCVISFAPEDESALSSRYSVLEVIQDFRWPTEAAERRSSPGSTWKSITHTPPDFSTPTPSSTALLTSRIFVTGPMPTAP